MSITYKYRDDGVVIQLQRIDSRWPHAVDVEFCAIGRFSPWPTKMMNPMWSNIAAIAGDSHEEFRKGIK